MTSQISVNVKSESYHFQKFDLLANLKNGKSVSKYQREDIMDCYGFCYNTLRNIIKKAVSLELIQDQTGHNYITRRKLNQQEFTDIIKLLGIPTIETPPMYKWGIARCYNMWQTKAINADILESELIEDWAKEFWQSSYFIFPSVLLEVKKEMGEPMHDFIKFYSPHKSPTWKNKY